MEYSAANEDKQEWITFPYFHPHLQATPPLGREPGPFSKLNSSHEITKVCTYTHSWPVMLKAFLTKPFRY